MNEAHVESLATLIRTRRSVARFRPDPIPDGLVETLLETAVYAPNHRLTEPWRFVLISDQGVQQYAAIRQAMALPSLKAMSEAKREQIADDIYRKFSTVPAYLLVIMAENGTFEIAEEDYAACAALIQNFLLLAWERGIGSCWKSFKNDPRLREFVGLQAREKVVGIIHLGYPEAVPSSKRQSARERLTYIR